MSQKELKYIDSVADVYSSLGNRSLISKSYVYVVRDDKENFRIIDVKEWIEDDDSLSGNFGY